MSVCVRTRAAQRVMNGELPGIPGAIGAAGGVTTGVAGVGAATTGVLGDGQLWRLLEHSPHIGAEG